MVDAAIEEMHTNLSRFWTKTEDTLAGAGAAILMPFIQPLESFKPDGEGLESDDDDAEDVTEKKKPEELRKEHDVRNKQLLEGAFRGTLHLQMDYAFEQNRLVKEMVRAEANLDKAVAAISRKIPSWQLIKAKDIFKDKEKKNKFLDDFMPPKLRKGPTKKEEEKNWIGNFFSQKKHIRDLKKVVQSIKGELARLETANPESKTALQYLLEEHAEINVPDQEGFTALMLAARNGHLETVRALMECDGIEVGKKNKFGSNAMHYASMYAHAEIVTLLREGMNGKKINKRDKNLLDKTPMDLALEEDTVIKNHKNANWEQTYKMKKFLLVKEMKPKDVPDNPIYNAIGLHDPGAIEPPKKYAPGRWRVSKIPDPACRKDDFTEAEYLRRWNSAAKKCWAPPK